MPKITYKVDKEEKQIDIVELDWKTYLKVTDLTILLQNPKTRDFATCAELVQIYTGKSDEEMLKWMKTVGSTNFMNELSAVLEAIVSENESKKK